MDDIAPLDPEMRALLDEVEVPRSTIAPALQAQIEGRLAIALQANVSTDASATATRPAQAPSMPGLRRWLTVGAAALAGAAVTHFAEHAARPRVEAPAMVAAAPPAVGEASSVVASPLLGAASVHEEAPAPSAPRPPASSPSPAAAPASRAALEAATPPADVHDGDLASEARLIDTALAALAHRDFAAALASVQRHEREYPRGRLTEEREALAVQAFAGSGRAGDARARAATFRRRYPKSVFLRLVDAAAGEAP